eukprot:TRINITY_DN8108_c0_g1_i1.p1 TRINITY_DN8108_c0_g1~~TRINITY_DN8108_c0_g1_i1.p1  ORF type:complete len:293 (+),score=51.62 TRINITY_DN8108_c0_g1_i1:162-1040(+)
MSPEELTEIIVTGPRVKLAAAEENTPLVVDHVEYTPLGNLVFTRDQQIVTPRGVVLARLAAPQRDNEVRVLRKCFELLGIPIVGSVSAPGTLEGGDFIPLGTDLCLIGVGLRTNMQAVEECMENDWFGTRRVGVVIDETDLSQDRMHLDTVFNIASPKHCVILDRMLKASGEDKMQRYVLEYVRDAETGEYNEKRRIHFEDFLVEEGFTIIPFTNEDRTYLHTPDLHLSPARPMSYLTSHAPASARPFLACHFTPAHSRLHIPVTPTDRYNPHCVPTTYSPCPHLTLASHRD